MNAKITLLIADRNPHVREFLKRELQADVCDVQLASTGVEMMRRMQADPPDMLIIDPDMPDIADMSFIRQIHEVCPQLLIVIHSLLTDADYQRDDSIPLIFVEKRGSSIDHLKHVINDILEMGWMP